MEKRPPSPQKTNEELLVQADRFANYARNNYGRTDNDLANTAALVSLAGSALVIARLLNEQAIPQPDDMAGPNGDAQ